MKYLDADTFIREARPSANQLYIGYDPASRISVETFWSVRNRGVALFPQEPPGDLGWRRGYPRLSWLVVQQVKR